MSNPKYDSHYFDLITYLYLTIHEDLSIINNLMLRLKY